MCNYCIHLRLPTGDGCFIFSPCVEWMCNGFVEIIDVILPFGCRNDGITAKSSSSWESSATEGGLEWLRSYS